MMRGSARQTPARELARWTESFAEKMHLNVLLQILGGQVCMALIKKKTKFSSCIVLGNSDGIEVQSHTAKKKCQKFEANIPRKGILGPQSQFPHSCVCERSIYSHRFCWKKYVDRFSENINRSQTHEGRNWGWGRAIRRKGIYKRNCLCSAYMRKSFLIYEEMHKDFTIYRRRLVIYDFAPDPSLRNVFFLFYQCGCSFATLPRECSSAWFLGDVWIWTHRAAIASSIIEDQAFSPSYDLDWLLPPLLSGSLTGDTQKDWEWGTTCSGERGRGVGEEPIKACYSLIH